MSNINELKIATNIYYYLLKNNWLSENDDSALYISYSNPETQKYLKILAEASDCAIKMINGVIYLIPNRDNKLLAYTRSELRKTMFKSNSTASDYYLGIFIIEQLILTLYNSTTDTQARFQVTIGELENTVSETLDKIQKHRNISDIESEYKKVFSNLIGKWGSLKGSDTANRRSETRVGFISNVLAFLSSQDLIIWYETDGIIKPTKHFTNKVLHILNKNEFKKTESLYQTIRNEELF